MSNQDEKVSPDASGQGGPLGDFTTHAYIGPEPLGTIMPEHDWEILVGAHGHPIKILCTCSWKGRVMEE